MKSSFHREAMALLFALAQMTVVAQPGGGPGGPGGRGGRPGGGAVDKSADTVLARMIETEVPKFQLFSYEDEATGLTMQYHLFIPKDYDPNQRYPLLLFIADASTVGSLERPLNQGWGALIWVTEEEQRKHPSFVLVPAYNGRAVDDLWNTSGEVAATIPLVNKICSDYSIDRDRLYTTGQSMGGMMSFYFNITYPHFFAASLFVGSQWDTTKMAPFIGNKFFYIVGGGDERASGGMEALDKVLNEQGWPPTRAEWSAKLSQEEQEANVKEMIAKGNNINFITFTKGTVQPESGRGIEHMNSFDYAYKLEAVRDWLFSQTLDTYAPATCPSVWALSGDWHGPNVTPLLAIKKAIDKGAHYVVFDVAKNDDGLLVLVSSHDETGVEATLADACSLAKGRIYIALGNPKDYISDIQALTDEQKRSLVLLRMDAKVEGLNTVPYVDLDDSSWKDNLQEALGWADEYVELKYSKSDTQLDDAMAVVKDKVKVVVSTTEAGLAGEHVDLTIHGDVLKAWGELKDRGVDGIITNQVKPMMRWVERTE